MAWRPRCYLCFSPHVSLDSHFQRKSKKPSETSEDEGAPKEPMPEDAEVERQLEFALVRPTAANVHGDVVEG